MRIEFHTYVLQYNITMVMTHTCRGAKEALVVTNRPIVSNELFEISVGGGSGFKGVKGEMKARLKGKESVRIGVTVHW